VDERDWLGRAAILPAIENPQTIDAIPLFALIQRDPKTAHPYFLRYIPSFPDPGCYTVVELTGASGYVTLSSLVRAARFSKSTPPASPQRKARLKVSHTAYKRPPKLARFHWLPAIEPLVSADLKQ